MLDSSISLPPGRISHGRLRSRNSANGNLGLPEVILGEIWQSHHLVAPWGAGVVVPDAGSGWNLRDTPRNVFSIVFAALSLVLLSPLFLLIVAAIKLDSRGPGLFKQERYGRGGKTFLVYKFRTMKVTESGSDAVQCVSGDPRITRLGSILRKMSIDELPQLLNVIRGEMNLVGPRPHPMVLDGQFAPWIRNYMQRYSVTPGLTGLAQIRGLRGPTETVDKMAARVAADLEYVGHRSLLYDLGILMKTIPALLMNRKVF